MKEVSLIVNKYVYILLCNKLTKSWYITWTRCWKGNLSNTQNHGLSGIRNHYSKGIEYFIHLTICREIR